MTRQIVGSFYFVRLKLGSIYLLTDPFLNSTFKKNPEHHMKQSHKPKALGMTHLEAAIVIAVLFCVCSILFILAHNRKKGQDKAFREASERTALQQRVTESAPGPKETKMPAADPSPEK
jgi:preprotein translocase subunit SecG